VIEIEKIVTSWNRESRRHDPKWSTWDFHFPLKRESLQRRPQ